MIRVGVAAAEITARVVSLEPGQGSALNKLTWPATVVPIIVKRSFILAREEIEK